jgi:hypothetical protein
MLTCSFRRNNIFIYLHSSKGFYWTLDLKKYTNEIVLIWQTPTGNENIFRSGLFHVAIKKQIIHT